MLACNLEIGTQVHMACCDKSDFYCHNRCICKGCECEKYEFLATEILKYTKRYKRRFLIGHYVVRPWDVILPKAHSTLSAIDGGRQRYRASE